VNVTALETLAGADVVGSATEASGLADYWLALVKVVVKQHLVLLCECLAAVEALVFHFRFLALGVFSTE
jgi:hypothetical protein